MEERERFSPEVDEGKRLETDDDVEAHRRSIGEAEEPREPGEDGDDVEAHRHAPSPHRGSHDV